MWHPQTWHQRYCGYKKQILGGLNLDPNGSYPLQEEMSLQRHRT